MAQQIATITRRDYMSPVTTETVTLRSDDGAQICHLVPMRLRRHNAGTRDYAMVPDSADDTWYIWEQRRDAWYGPYATRLDAELALARHRTTRVALRIAPDPARRPAPGKARQA